MRLRVLIWLTLLTAAALPSAAQQPAYTNTRSPHGNLSIPCQNCHTAAAWKPIRAIPEFDHNKTRYPLQGMHQNVACMQCHTKPVFTNVGSKCADCHADIHRRQMGAACETCHTVKGWDVSLQAVQNHQNRFPLMGAHAALDCQACHKGAAVGQYMGLSTQCYSCHARDYQQTANPNHVLGKFPTTCEQCHGMDNWFNAKFDHAAVGFPLTGAHATLQCVQCHVNNNYNLTSANTVCVSCHLNDYNTAVSPVNHVQAGFPTTCQTCHDTVAWTDGKFDHSTTGWALTGAHATVACTQCHINSNYKLTNTACVSCHLKDFQATTNPNHVQQGFAQTCESCHNTAAWQPAQFDHSKSGFPLTGAHATTPCAQCHVNNNYTITNTACVSCHQNDYNTAVSPVNHIQLGFPTTCQNCHDTVSWLNGKFDHSTTGWALTGTHATTPCAQCHINNNYSLTSANTVCVSCHLNDYNTAVSPVNHVQAAFPTTCDTCHDTVVWTDGKFDHSTTGWALTGTHATTPCTQCHVNNNYKLTNTACVSCHQTDYNNAVSPVNHVAAGFPTTCDSCHDTVVWTDGKFNHTTTGFALTGAHATLQCTQCHVNNNYKLSSTACVTCHQTDYNNARTPVDHVTLGFPTACDMCHDTVAWTDATFNHNNTPFPLTGAHTTVPCANCHVNNNYTTVPTDCYSCHKADYQGTTNPNHTAAGFPTTCQTCHTTTSWAGATFNHTWFPTNHGNAQGVCSTCHTNSSNYAVFTCTNCHTQATTTQQHQGVNNFVWNSTNCYQCHPSGRAG